MSRPQSNMLKILPNVLLGIFRNFYLLPYSGKVWQGNVWQIDSFQAFGKRKFGEIVDQPTDY